MTPSRVLASAVLLAATCCPDPAEAFMPMRRAAPNNVVDRGAVDGTPKRRDAFQPTGFFARVPLTNGGNVDAKSMQTLFRAPTARDHADSSRGTACPAQVVRRLPHGRGGSLPNAKLVESHKPTGILVASPGWWHISLR